MLTNAEVNVAARAGLAVGTPAFMSPEQCRGDREIDNRSDIYALGVILFDLFAGHVPFDGESVIEVMNHHLRTPPPSLHDEVGMPLALEAVINQALAKYPEDRFEDVAALFSSRPFTWDFTGGAGGEVMRRIAAPLVGGMLTMASLFIGEFAKIHMANSRLDEAATRRKRRRCRRVEVKM